MGKRYKVLAKARPKRLKTDTATKASASHKHLTLGRRGSSSLMSNRVIPFFRQDFMILHFKDETVVTVDWRGLYQG